MRIGPVVSTSALLLAFAIAVPGCALNRSLRKDPSAVPTSRAVNSSATLDELDPAIPKPDDALGNFPASAPLDVFRNERDPQSLEAKLGLARLDQLAGRVEQAEESFREAAQAHAGNPLALTALGLFYASEGRWAEAAQSLDRAVTLDPHDDVIRNQYAIALAHTGRIDQALDEFSISVGEAEAHYNVGYIHWQGGRTKLAEREFRRSLAIRPDLNRARTMLDRIATATVPVGSLYAREPIPNPARVVPASGSATARQATNAVWPEVR